MFLEEKQQRASAMAELFVEEDESIMITGVEPLLPRLLMCGREVQGYKEHRWLLS